MKTLLFILMIFIASCSNKKQGLVNITEEKIADLNYKYMISGDIRYLDSIYNYIKANKSILNEINDSNLPLIYPTYFNLGLYSELSEIIKKSKVSDELNKKLLLNLLEAYSFYKKENRIGAEKLLKLNEEILEGEVIANPTDSILIIDLYKMKVHLYDIDSIISEIEVRQKVNNGPSTFFYQKILLPEIKEYYMTLPEFVKSSR